MMKAKCKHNTLYGHLCEGAKAAEIEIQRLRRIINRAGGLALQHASHELIRSTLAELDNQEDAE